jgi:hypothetical protein
MANGLARSLFLMHTPILTHRDKAVPRADALSRIARPGRWLAGGVLAGLLLAACGGGGGGGGSDGGAPTGSTVSSSGVPFPIGMTLASPAALAASTSVVSGGLGIVELGIGASTTPLQSVMSSQVDALATGRLNLAGSHLLTLSALFDTSPRSHAACQGPEVAYQNHDDAPGGNGTLARGAVAMWSDTETSSASLPCGVAELNAQTQGLSAQTNQAMLLMAALRYAIVATGIQMPTPGQTVNLATGASSLFTSLLGGISIESASVALNSIGSEYTYRLALAQGSDATAQTLDITLLHTPAETDIRYAGVLQMTQSYLGTDASIGCGDQVDSASRYKVARLTSVGYNRQDQWMSLRVRSGQYCGHPGNSSTAHAGQIATLTTSGVDLEGAARRRGAGRDQGDRHLPHRRVHALRRRSRRLFPAILGHEGRGRRGRRRPGRDVAEEGRPRHPALHARMPAVQVVPVAQDQPLHRDPRDAGQGRDARRHLALLARRQADPSLHGLLDLRELHRAARDRAGEDPRGRAVRQGLLHRLRRHHRHRRGDQHRQGRAGANVVVFGLGGIGLNVIQGARMAAPT